MTQMLMFVLVIGAIGVAIWKRCDIFPDMCKGKNDNEVGVTLPSDAPRLTKTGIKTPGPVSVSTTTDKDIVNKITNPLTGQKGTTIIPRGTTFNLTGEVNPGVGIIAKAKFSRIAI